MIKHLSNITEITVIDQNQRDNINRISRVDFVSDPMGSGSFGSIHKVTSIDGIQKDEYVLKIILEESFKNQAYEVLCLLHYKIKRHQTRTNIPIYHEYPELLGLPFLGFKGFDIVSDQHCVAFLMYDMNYIGFEDYSSDYKKDTLSNYSLTDRLYLAYQLSKALHFLHSNDFVHSDFNEHSLFINFKRIQISLIDFDGGFHFDTQKKPSTIGKIGQWISGKFRNIIGRQEDASVLSTEERINEEYWLLANAIFEVIFGVMPFFFLVEADDKTKRSYLKDFEWLLIDLTSDLVNKKNIDYHKNLLESLNQLEQAGASDLIKAFKTIFNKGYSNENKRLSALEWKKSLWTLIKEIDNKPIILDYNCNKKVILSKNEEVSLQWFCKKYNALFINDSLVNLNTNSLSLNLPSESNLILKAINDFETVEELLCIKAEKIDPEIIYFSASKNLRESLDSVKLSWSTKNASHVLISGNESNLSSEGELDIYPKEKTTYTLKAVGHFDQEIVESIVIDVLQPKITKFDYEINLNEGIDNIDLFWKTDDSIRVSINPRIGEVDLNGLTHIRISEKTLFTLIAESHFGKVSQTIETHPFPVPIINQIFVETPGIDLNINFSFIGADLIEDKLITDSNALMKSIEIENSLDTHLFEETIIPFIRFDNALLKNHVTDIHIENFWDKIQNNLTKRKIYRSLLEKIVNELKTRSNAK